MCAVPRTILADVAVIGGGPAGCAAALTLLKYSSLRVVVAESSNYSGFRLGENVPPGVTPLLTFLDAAQCLENECHIPAQGTGAAWGGPEVFSRDFLFTGQGHGWYLDRRRFDRSLADLVRKRGGKLLLGARVAETRREHDQWRLIVQQKKGDRRVQLQVRWIIDASGRNAVSAHKLANVRLHDRLLGVAALYNLPVHPANDSFALVEAAPLGWWYSAPLPDRRMIVVFMSDADLVRKHALCAKRSWLEHVATSTHTRRRLHEASNQLPLHIRPAYSQVAEPPTGKGWVAAGDAAASFDPLTSMGIGYALLSGIESARVAHNVLGGSGYLVQRFAESVADHFYNYLRLRRSVYRIEQRWPDQPFWSRRHQ